LDFHLNSQTRLDETWKSAIKPKLLRSFCRNPAQSEAIGKNDADTYRAPKHFARNPWKMRSSVLRSLSDCMCVVVLLLKMHRE